VPVGLRWWDGTDWTPYAAPATPPFDEQRSAKAASIARWAMVGQAVAATVMSLFAYSVWRRMLDVLDAAFSGEMTQPGNTTTAVPPWMNLFSFASIAVTGCLMYWSHRATTDARDLGWTTRHEAGMATASWIIPIISLWFPYQVVADLAAPEQRRRVGWWWAAHLSAGPLAAIPVIVGFATDSAAMAAVAAVIPIAVAWTAAILGGSLVRHVHERQRARANPSTEPATAQP